MSNTNTSTSTTDLAEQNAKNINAIADAIGMKRSQLHTGASRKEKVDAAKRAALFGFDTDDVDIRSDKAVRNDLRRQNAKNLLRIAKKVGVPARKLSGKAARTKMESEKADYLGLPPNSDEAE